MIIIYIFSRPY